MICHGQDFISRQPAGESVWNSRVDHMMGKTLFDRPASSYAEGLLSYRATALRFSREDRQALFAYLVKNFGPGAKPRRVRIEQEMPLDEGKLGKSMFIEYYLPDDPPGQGVHSPEFTSLKGPFCCGRRVGQDVRLDDAGNVWLTDRGYPHRLVRLDPRTGEQKDYPLPNGSRNGIHEVIVDRSGVVWLPEHSGSQRADMKHLLGFNPKTGNIAKFDTHNNQSFVLYPKPQAQADTPKIQVTRDEAIWYSPRGSQNSPAIGVLYPDMDKISTLGAFPVNGSPGLDPTGERLLPLVTAFIPVMQLCGAAETTSTRRTIGVGSGPPVVLPASAQAERNFRMN